MDLITELVDKIKYYSQKYYQGEESISDAEFDKLVEKLQQLDPNNKILTTVGWGYDISKNHKIKTEHLGEAYGISSKIYVDKTRIIPEFSNTVRTGKIDGGSVELVYFNGKLMKAVTRGNGKVGIDVTHILKYIVPIELPYKYTGNFLGEFVLPDELITFDDSIAQRNIPNGFLQRNEVSKEECERFIYVPYKINKFKPLPELVNYTRVGILEFIDKCGFCVISRFDSNYENNLTYSETLTKLKIIKNNDKIYNVPLDGIVIHSDKIIVSEVDYEGYCTIQYVNESAYKTVNDSAEVIVTNIDWNLTRTGKLIPTVEFEPIELSGAEVKRALAHNAKNVVNSGIGIGSRIKVIRSGEVIPYIYDVITPVEVELPVTCPICGQKLVMHGVNLCCDNIECSGKSYESVVRWIKILGNTDNLGSSMINSLITNYNLYEIKDLYDDRIDFNSLSKIEGFGKSKIQIIVNMYKKLFEKKPLNHVMVALNINGLSYENAYKIVKYTNIEKMIKTNSYSENIFKSEMESIKGLSSTVITNLIKNFNKIINNIQFVNLIDFNEYYEPKVKSSVKLLKIYVTGKLVNFKNREELYLELSDKVEKESDISKCDYFVTNKFPLTTNHYKKAVEMNIKIITEKELLTIIDRKKE